jgi:tetratricopeptide (TPR) repeat protein
MRQKDEEKKAVKLESKGDKLLQKKKYEKALNAFEQALNLNPESSELIDKLIETHELSTEEWNIEDFTKHLSWTMKRQELDNPRLHRLHEKLSPEFEEITKLILEFAKAPNEELEEEYIARVIEYGEKALIPLIEFIRTLKHLEDKKSEEKETESKND